MIDIFFMDWNVQANVNLTYAFKFHLDDNIVDFPLLLPLETK